MTPKLTKKLARIKAACRKVLELDQRAISAPWKDDGTGHMWHEYPFPDANGYEGEHITLGKFDPPEFAFIAFARSITPDMARALLAQIEKHEACIVRFGSDFNQAVHDYAVECLQSIADSFQETSLP